jgi:hypothetical protein
MYLLGLSGSGNVPPTPGAPQPPPNNAPPSPGVTGSPSYSYANQPAGAPYVPADMPSGTYPPFFYYSTSNPSSYSMTGMVSIYGQNTSPAPGSGQYSANYTHAPPGSPGAPLPTRTGTTTQHTPAPTNVVHPTPSRRCTALAAGRRWQQRGQQRCSAQFQRRRRRWARAHSTICRESASARRRARAPVNSLVVASVSYS